MPDPVRFRVLGTDSDSLATARRLLLSKQWLTGLVDVELNITTVHSPFGRPTS